MKRSPTQHSAHLIAIAHDLMKYLPDTDLQAAFLFGSAAWGDADASSDLDIMLLLDRPAGYREVTRVRLADLFGYLLLDGPIFADLDRISVKTFISRIYAGAWTTRVVNSIILTDTNDFYARLRAQVSRTFLHPLAREKRFLARQEQTEESRIAALKGLDSDVMLSALHARLALQHAAATLIELNANRVSPSHFVESLEQVLGTFDNHLFAMWLAALSLDAPYEAVNRSLRAYNACAHALKRQVEDSSTKSHLSQEDLAWAQHIYGKPEEITYKVAMFTRENRLPALLYYLDGLFLVPICIQMGKIFSLRSSGKAECLTIPDFYIALCQELALCDEWLSALRLSAERGRVIEAANLAAQLLNVGRAML